MSGGGGGEESRLSVSPRGMFRVCFVFCFFFFFSFASSEQSGKMESLGVVRFSENGKLILL